MVNQVYQGCLALGPSLIHHGIKGQKWGVRRFQNPDGTWTDAGKSRRRGERTVFISGSSKTQTEDSAYYRQSLPEPIQKILKSYMDDKVNVVVGDAPGIDRQVQDFFNEHQYDRVQVYGPGKEVRYTANKNWKTNPIDAPEFEEGSKEWLAKKDIAMERVSTEGLAVVLDEGAKATRKNVDRLLQNGKTVQVYELNKQGRDFDKWLKHTEGGVCIMGETFSSSDYLMHWGIKGMKWGIRRYQNEDGSLTPAGIKRYRTVENFERARASKEGAKAVSKEVSAEDRAAEIQRQKEIAIAKGDAKKILELRGEMTTAEINEAYNRLNTLNNINKLIPPEKTRSEKIKEFMTTAQATIKTINDYNNAQAAKWKAKAAKEDALLKRLNYKDEKKQKKKEAKEEKKEKKSEKKQEKQEKQEQKQEQKHETKQPESKPTETSKAPSMFDRVSNLNKTAESLNSKSRSEIAGPLQKRDSSVDKIWSGIGKTPSSGSPLRTKVSDLLSNPVYSKDRFSSVQTLISKANAKNSKSSMSGVQPIRSLDNYESTYVGKQQFKRLFG